MGFSVRHAWCLERHNPRMVNAVDLVKFSYELIDDTTIATCWVISKALSTMFKTEMTSEFRKVSHITVKYANVFY